MPAVSRNQRVAAAIAEHEPGKLYKRNRGMLKMGKADLHDYASTKDLDKKKAKPNAYSTLRPKG